MFICNLFTQRALRSSQELVQKCPCIPGLTCNFFLKKRWFSRRKTSRTRVHDAGPGNRTQVGGEYSDHYATKRKFHKKIFPCKDEVYTLRVTDSKYRESLDRFKKSKTLKLCLKNAFREFSSKILFRFSKNLTLSRNSQKTKIHLFTSLNMQKISGKLTKFSVFALKQFTILEHGINLAQKFHLSSI